MRPALTRCAVRQPLLPAPAADVSHPRFLSQTAPLRTLRTSRRRRRPVKVGRPHAGGDVAPPLNARTRPRQAARRAHGLHRLPVRRPSYAAPRGPPRAPLRALGAPAIHASPRRVGRGLLPTFVWAAGELAPIFAPADALTPPVGRTSTFDSLARDTHPPRPLRVASFSSLSGPVRPSLAAPSARPQQLACAVALCSLPAPTPIPALAQLAAPPPDSSPSAAAPRHRRLAGRPVPRCRRGGSGPACVSPAWPSCPSLSLTCASAPSSLLAAVQGTAPIAASLELGASSSLTSLAPPSSIFSQPSAAKPIQRKEGVSKGEPNGAPAPLSSLFARASVRNEPETRSRASRRSRSSSDVVQVRPFLDSLLALCRGGCLAADLAADSLSPCRPTWSSRRCIVRRPRSRSAAPGPRRRAAFRPPVRPRPCRPQRSSLRPAR